MAPCAARRTARNAPASLMIVLILNAIHVQKSHNRGSRALIGIFLRPVCGKCGACRHVKGFQGLPARYHYKAEALTAARAACCPATGQESRRARQRACRSGAARSGATGPSGP